LDGYSRAIPRQMKTYRKKFGIAKGHFALDRVYKVDFTE
jgi:hypothetical protein